MLPYDGDDGDADGYDDGNDDSDYDDDDDDDDVCGLGGHFHANRSQDGSTTRRLLQPSILNPTTLGSPRHFGEGAYSLY